MSVEKGLMSSCDTVLRSPVLGSDNPMTIQGLVPMISKMQLIAN
jgi:hypothetical protein